MPRTREGRGIFLPGRSQSSASIGLLGFPSVVAAAVTIRNRLTTFESACADLR